MSQFEFFMVLAAVVVAVAMTEIVGGWGRLIRTDAKVRPDWLHLGWSGYVLLLSMLYWIGMWPYASRAFVYVGQVWLLVLPTLFLVIVAYALTPSVPESGEVDLRQFYLAKRRRIFYCLSGFLVMALVADFTIVGYLTPSSLLLPGVSIVAFVLLAHLEKIWIHGVLMVLVLASALINGFLEITTLTGGIVTD